MPTITLNFTTDNAARVNAAFKAIWPMALVPDPGWVDPEDGTTAPMVNEFSDAEWAEIQFRQFAIRTVCRFERKQATDAAAAGVVEDEDLVTSGE